MPLLIQRPSPVPLADLVVKKGWKRWRESSRRIPLPVSVTEMAMPRRDVQQIKRGPERDATPVIVHSSKDLSPRETDDLKSMGALIFPKREFSSDFGSERLHELLAVAGIGK